MPVDEMGEVPHYVSAWNWADSTILGVGLLLFFVYYLYREYRD